MRNLSVLIAIALWPALLFCQSSSNAISPTTSGNVGNSATPASSSSDNTTNAGESKRLFGIVPNYRTSPSLANFQPITPKDKFKIASQDAFDRGTFILAAAFAGEAQLSKSEPTFGQGAAGYGRYLGTAYADYVIGDFMTEGVFPSLLHQDPRYFRRGKGSTWSRLFYSAGQIFLTHGDDAKVQVNYSELIGNSASVAISNAYYPSSRDVGDAVSKLGTQLGVDMASNVLKEFFPDIMRKFSRKHNN